MIRVNRNEQFPITVSLIDEIEGLPAIGRTVYYDVRKLPGDVALNPELSGILPESSVEPGIYKTLAQISEAGNYVIYATCSGFISNTENVIVNQENIYELTKQNRNYNTLVEDVIRENVVSTASQIVRKVAIGNTDYILTKVKFDSDSDWSGVVASGIVYAWYKDLNSQLPYRMGGPY